MKVFKFFYALSLAAFIGVLTLMVILGYWIFLPQNIVSYPKGATWNVTNSPVKSGGYVNYDMYYCKYTEDISTIYVTLVGHNLYTLAQTQRNIPIGCRNYLISDVYIPTNVVPGIYHLEITVQYKPNPIRVVQYYAQTNNFQITK